MANDFEKIYEDRIEELDSVATIYSHPGGASFYHIKNDDPNMVFGVMVNTYPDSDHGVPHILEHSVFCGSEKYPLKEPFVNLMKSSLNTFLNAMTMPDRTFFPVASANKKDLLNLTDVYLDAVFHPLIYDDPTIFMQEGCHFELDENGVPSQNGVVYNEEKGGMGSPETLVRHKAMKALMNGLYQYHAGGVPKEMIGMKRDEIVEFHKKFYRPGNSRFYLYGDVEPDEFFEKIEEATSSFDVSRAAEKDDISCGISEPAYVDEEYAGSDDMDVAGMTFYLEESGDTLKATCMRILISALFQFETSPVRRALIDSGLCRDVYADIDDARDVTLLHIVMFDVASDDAMSLEDAVLGAIGDVDADDIKELALASLSAYEFMARECEFGSTPRGVEFLFQLFTGKTSDSDPFRRLRYEDDIRNTGELIKAGGLGELIRDMILDNKKRVSVKLSANKEFIAKEEKEEARLVKEAWDRFSPDEKKEHQRLVSEMFRKQGADDGPEKEKLIPKLSPEDVREGIKRKDVNVREIKAGEGSSPKDIRVLEYDAFTSGIVYLRLYFPVREVSSGELFSLSTIDSLLGELPTYDHSAEELQQELLTKLGGFVTYIEVFDEDVYFVCEAKFYRDRLKEAVSLVKEILTKTSFEKRDLVISKMKELNARFREDITDEAMRLAVSEAVSKVKTEEAILREVSGIPYYDRLGELLGEGGILPKRSENVGKCPDVQVTKRSENVGHDEEGELEGVIDGFAGELNALLGADSMIIAVTAEKDDIEAAVDGLRACVSGFGAEMPENVGICSDGIDPKMSENVGICSDGIDPKMSEKVGKCPDGNDPERSENVGKCSDGIDPKMSEKVGISRPEMGGSAYIIDSPVQFIAYAGQIEGGGDRKLDGRYSLLKTLLESGYLWNEIRLKGGAYGTSAVFGRDGYFAFTTYRDPKLAGSVKVIRSVPEYLKDMELTEDDMFGLVLGSLNYFDRPLTPVEGSDAAINRWFRGYDTSDVSSAREELLRATPDDLKELADKIGEGLGRNAYTVFGNKAAIEEAEDLFSEVVKLREVD